MSRAAVTSPNITDLTIEVTHLSIASSDIEQGMDSIADPELASEMVKLLGQELKLVRAQLREAEVRASTLEEDNATLQERIVVLQDKRTRVSSIKLEEDLMSSLQYAEPTSLPSGDFTRLFAENEDLIREKEEASQNQEKLFVLQEKYRRSKAKVHEYNEMLNELRTALSSCVEELEQSRKTVVAEIDFRDFLATLPYKPMEGQQEFFSIQPYTRGVLTKVHKNAKDFCQGLYFINCSEVVWSPSGIALGLVIKPTFQYNPKVSGGAWIKLGDNFDVGKQVDLCCLSGKSSRYLGTYERVADQGTMIIASEALKHLDHDKLEHVAKCTTLFPDLMPPSQTQMIKNMYKQGVIKLRCFVIQCIGVNQTFAEKLRNTCAPPAQRTPSNDTVIPTPAVTGGEARKRKPEPKGHPAKHFKKRKH